MDPPSNSHFDNHNKDKEDKMNIVQNTGEKSSCRHNINIKREYI